MPSASTKSDTKPPVDPTDGVKLIQSIVEKKIRNLEKRKGKLDAYRAQKDSGKELNADQMEAISRYDQVLQNLELSKEFQKQFSSTLTDMEKLWKKQQKRDKLERQQEDQNRIKELLVVQNVLDSMGAESVREDFKSGQHGAVQLTEENLNQLDEVYKLISPTRESEVKFQEQLTTSSEHLAFLLEGKDKEVIGTTYKNLKSVFDKIVECGYLDRPVTEETAVEDEAEEEAEEEEEAPPAEIEEEQPQENGQLEDEVPGTDEFGTEEPEVQEPEPQELPAPALHPEVLTQEPQPEEQQPALTGGTTESEVVDDAFFSTAFHNKQRPFNEIVSSVQGKFNFLQDSEIDMDPAVVAAHPMPPTMTHHQTDSSLTPSMTSQSFQSSAFVDDQADSQQQPQQQQSSQQSALVTSQQTAPSLVNQSELDNTYTQNFTSHMTHSLQDSSLHTIANPSSDLSSHVTQSSATIGQTTHVPNTEPSVLPPQPIPMPNQTTMGQTTSSDLQTSQEKKFSMNANAAVFHSIYSQQQSSNYQPSQQTSSADSNSLGQESLEKEQNTQRSQQNDYQPGYNNYNRMNNNNNRGGGGRGGRGGGGQRGGMSNGYSRGDRGGSRGGAPFNNNRMGGGYNNAGRGGGNNNRVPYQGGGGGYQPRPDYRNEGFQGYNNTSSYSGGYNKRGNNSRGGMRGNSMRGSGGPPRGGNTWRGGRGGNGKPNIGYQGQSQSQPVQQMS